MGYSKSEIREAKKRIAHELNIIKERLPDIDKNWMASTLILRSLLTLKYVVDPLKTHIIDNDDYNLAIELNSMITPVWNEYCNSAKDDVSLKHQEAYDLKDIISDLREWIGEYETGHSQQPDLPTSTSSDENEESRSNYIVKKEVLSVLPSLYAFLVKKKVINDNKISCTDYTTAIEKADISGIYPNSVKYKFKTTIKAIQKCFTEDWFKAICKSAGISEDSMGKSNLQDTARQQWFKELDKILADL